MGPQSHAWVSALGVGMRAELKAHAALLPLLAYQHLNHI
jgi:hypothetical protein